jgi:hypothetical protein
LEFKMSFVGDAIGSVVGGITGAKQSAKAAGKAADTQAAAAQAGVDEQKRQFDALVELMAPYVEAGTGAISRLTPYEQAGQQAFGQQQALIGLQGPAAQQQAIAALEASPQFQAMQQQGENAILQNASATGGLRGGNVQAALSQFRPQVLNSLIEQQYGRLGGIAGAGLGVTGDLVTLGQASAAGQGAQGMQSASNIGNLLANQGAAIAGGQLAKGNVARQTFGDVVTIGGALAGAGAFGGAGGGAPVGGSGIKFTGF